MPSLGSGGGGDGHLAVDHLDLRLAVADAWRLSDRGGGLGRSQGAWSAGAEVDGGRHRQLTLRLGDGLGEGGHPVHNAPALRKLRGVELVAGLRLGSHGDAHLVATGGDDRLAVVDLVGVRDTGHRGLGGRGGVGRAHPGGDLRDHGTDGLDALRLGDRLGERVGPVAVCLPALGQVLVVDLLAGLGGGDHGHSHGGGGGGDLDGHLVSGGGDLRLGVGNALGAADIDRRLGRLTGARRADARSDLDGGQPRVGLVGEVYLDGLQTSHGDLRAVRVRDSVLDSLARECRVAVVDVAAGGNLLGQGDDRAIRHIVQGFRGAVSPERQLSAAGLTLVLIGPLHRVGGVAGDLSAGDSLLDVDVPDGVTRAGAATRDALDRLGGALLGVHGGLVGVLGARGNRAVRPQLQREHVQPIGLEVLTLVVDGRRGDILGVVNGDVERRST